MSRRAARVKIEDLPVPERDLTEQEARGVWGGLGLTPSLPYSAPGMPVGGDYAMLDNPFLRGEGASPRFGG